MKKHLFSITVASLLFGLYACHKDDHDHNKNDKESPQITIIQPTAVEFEIGDTVHIRINVVDNLELHDVHVHINHKVTGEEVYHLYRHSHSTEVNIVSWWIAEAPTGHEDYILKVEAEDAAGNKAEKTHEFHVH